MQKDFISEHDETGIGTPIEPEPYEKVDFWADDRKRVEPPQPSDPQKAVNDAILPEGD